MTAAAGCGQVWELTVGVAAVAGVTAALATAATLWLWLRATGCPRCRHRQRLLRRHGHTQTRSSGFRNERTIRFPHPPRQP